MTIRLSRVVDTVIEGDNAALAGNALPSLMQPIVDGLEVAGGQRARCLLQS